jgi:hypothetical protein
MVLHASLVFFTQLVVHAAQGVTQPSRAATMLLTGHARSMCWHLQHVQGTTTAATATTTVMVLEVPASCTNILHSTQ